MKVAPSSRGLRQAFCLRPGLNLNVADFTPHESTETRFQSTTPLLRFYFHIAGSGYWELRSPHGGAAENRITHFDRFSTVLFYPELEGKMYLPAERRQFHLSINISPTLLNSYLGDHCEAFPKSLRRLRSLAVFAVRWAYSEHIRFAPVFVHFVFSALKGREELGSVNCTEQPSHRPFPKIREEEKTG